jgi:hypothetical protein
MTDKDMVNCVWMTVNEEQKAKNLHQQCNTAVDMIIKTALVRKSLDNVTCILIAFENFEKLYNKLDTEVTETFDEVYPIRQHRYSYNEYTSKLGASLGDKK